MQMPKQSGSYNGEFLNSFLRHWIASALSYIQLVIARLINF
jgi:hypothetical protein